MPPSPTPGVPPGQAAAWPEQNDVDTAIAANHAWELDRATRLRRSERRAWWVAAVATAMAALGMATVFAQGRLRQTVEIPIVIDRNTGETTIQQRLAVETIPQQDALDKHHVAAFVRAREGYSWMFLQRDFDQVARMAVPSVFNAYSRRYEGEDALQKKLGANEEWRIHIVAVRLSAAGRRGNRGEATVSYDKVVQAADHSRPDATSRHSASVVFEYQPQTLAKESDRLENPLGFVVSAYRSDPEIAADRPGVSP